MSNFTDLRLNHSGGHTDEGFWPSFTDIMMVVVMIFLITSATLILRNTELIRKISETELAQQLASEQAQDSLQQNATLEEQLRAVQRQLSLARLQQMQTMEDKFALQEQLKDTQQQLAALELAHEDLNAELSEARTRDDTNQQTIDVLQQQLEQSEQRRGVAAADLESTLAQLEATNQSLNALQQQYNLSREELTEAIAKLAASDTQITQLQRDQSQQLETVQLSEEKLIALRAEYDDLKVKYDKLVRPARTTKGKHVVAVRYFRENNGPVIAIKEPADADFRRIDEPAMHQLLGDLKEQYNETLYIKIIIPDGSELSYNEAWQFTRDLLGKYDYYHQGDYQPVSPIE